MPFEYDVFPAQELVPKCTVIMVAFTQGKDEEEELQFRCGVYESHDETQLCFYAGVKPVEFLSLPLSRVRKVGVMEPKSIVEVLNSDAQHSWAILRELPELQMT